MYINPINNHLISNNKFINLYIRVEGSVTITFLNNIQDQTSIVLDNKTLVIHKVTNGDNKDLEFSFSTHCIAADS